MVYEKSERAICSMGFGRTSFQQGGKVPTGYLGRFLGKGLEAFEPPGISPHLPLSHLPSPAWSLFARQPAAAFLFLCLPLSSSVLHTLPLPPASAQMPPFRKDFLDQKGFQLPSFSVLFCLFFLLHAVPGYYTPIYLLACLSCYLKCKCKCMSRG
ncbi:unnamed protein product [Gulo gulo]|uniref:Uncharacterized protein n=1 Tax=Gulo gulo TaxID=48420 RepID=A0A9X9PZM8_GULGU|nr:unnamed protein product [Gulo gulo]